MRRAGRALDRASRHPHEQVALPVAAHADRSFRRRTGGHAGIPAASITAELRVEVKRTTRDAATVILTRNEVTAARAGPDSAALAIVYGITLDAGKRHADGGVLHVMTPWHPADDALSRVAYRYQVPPR